MTDKVREFGKQAKKLVERSPYRERLEWLLKRPELGKIANRELPADHSSYDRQSNCFGTLLFILEGNGICNQVGPFFNEPESIDRYTRQKCEKTRGKDIDIVIFRCGEGKTRHAALYLGQAAGYKAIFHQPGTGEDYAIHPLEKFLTWRPIFESVDFYKIKEQ